MKKLQLFRQGVPIIATDGVMNVDGRYGLNRTIKAVQDRNNRFSKNFPHKVADSFAVYTTGRIGGPLSKIINL